MKLLRCPQCKQESYDVEADTCRACGYTREYTECVICGKQLALAEQELSGVCFEHAGRGAGGEG
jgi:hypothetical protein